MTFFSARRSACVLSAVAAGALMAPSLASAKKPAKPEACSGAAAIEGKGSTLQNNAQKSVWTVDFNTSKDSTACSVAEGKKKVVKVVYNKSGVTTGSVHGMEAFGLNKNPTEAATFNFVGTDEPPNSEQLKEMEAANKGAKIASIPVLQASVAILIHLPKKCTATNKTGENAGRLVVSNASLGEIFLGKATTWKAILAANKAAGDEIVAAEPEKKECEEDAFKVIVRTDGSGTTHIIKRYLGLINDEKVKLENGNEGQWSEGTGGKTDETLDQGEGNTVWPEALNKEREWAGAKEGGGALVEWVAKEPNTIGYANLSDARAHGFAPKETGGVKESGVESPIFWAPVENAAGKGKKPPHFEDPSTDGETSKTATSANCEDTKYTNGTEKFPPKSVYVPWSQVTTATSKEKTYTICGLTYDLAFESYTAAGLTEEVGTSVENYLAFELSEGTEGGQNLINNFDYLKLGKKLDKIGTKALKTIS